MADTDNDIGHIATKMALFGGFAALACVGASLVATGTFIFAGVASAQFIGMVAMGVGVYGGSQTLQGFTEALFDSIIKVKDIFIPPKIAEAKSVDVQKKPENPVKDKGITPTRNQAKTRQDSPIEDMNPDAPEGLGAAILAAREARRNNPITEMVRS